MPERGIFNTETEAAGPLTEEDFLRAVEAIHRRSEWERAHPHGLDGKNPHLVSSRTRKRLLREGGYAFCGSCMGWFYIAPPEHRA